MEARLGPYRLDREEFAAQAFRASHDQVDRLPAQLRGAIITRIMDMTMDEALRKIESGECAARLRPHDAFLAFSGQPF